MDKVTSKDLFKGIPSVTGGVSNERELASICPKEFNPDNNWYKLAENIASSGLNVQQLQWKTRPGLVRLQQVACLLALFASKGLEHTSKMSLAAWMLSEMLSQIPGENIASQTLEK